MSFGGDLVLYLSRNATKIIQASRREQGEEYVAVTNRNASGNNSRQEPVATEKVIMFQVIHFLRRTHTYFSPKHVRGYNRSTETLEGLLIFS